MTLDVLPPEGAVRLLAEVMGRERVEAEPDAALRVAELCGRLPLALRVVAERAAGRPAAGLGEVADELVRERDRLDALATDEDELSDVRAVFSWSYRALAPELRRAFRLLGLHAGGEIGAEAAAALMGVEVAVARRRLRALVGASLLQEVRANRCRLHDLLRLYAVERLAAEETAEQRTLAVRRVLSWYLLTTDKARQAVLPYSPAVPLVPAGTIDVVDGFADGPEAMRWFDGERANLLAALRQAADLGQYDIAWKLAMASTGLFEVGAHWADWENNHRIGYEAALALGDRFGEVANLQMLGDIAWRYGRWDEAAERYRRVVGVARELGIGWLEGFALRGLGLAQEGLGDVDEARGHFEAALRVFQVGGVRRGEAMALLSLGNCARARGDFREAVAVTAQAVEIFTEIEDTWTAATGAVDLAADLRGLGRKGEAADRLRQAARTFGDFADPRGQATALVPLGEILVETGDLDEARDCWRRALALYESLADPQADDVRARLAHVDPPG